MPYIPHTEDDVQQMLKAIGVNTIDDLFDEIPNDLLIDHLNETIVPTGISEMEAKRAFADIASKDKTKLSFIGAGAYEHHIPAIVGEIVNRGEFLTAYTPYQAEASQGLLQTIYEYQTMMASLLGLDVTNASLYDGATALAEAILMTVRANRRSKSRKILIPATLHPAYRHVVKSIVSQQAIEIVELPYCTGDGHTVVESLKRFVGEDITAIVIPQPNFFGVLEEVDALTDWGHAQGALVIGVVNPIAMAIFKEPGKWGKEGVDIACGEGQPLGIPLASGGPYFGFLSCKQALVRQIPGRIVGRTVDSDGKQSFTLTLQAREQHIRRSKATSNICTNQGLMAIAATVFMSVMGYEGLRAIATISHNNTAQLVDTLTEIDGVEQLFTRPFFHEAVIRLNRPANQVLSELAKMGIQGGFSLTNDYPELGECLLVCATETKTTDDIELYKQALQKALAT